MLETMEFCFACPLELVEKDESSGSSLDVEDKNEAIVALEVRRCVNGVARSLILCLELVVVVVDVNA